MSSILFPVKNAFGRFFVFYEAKFRIGESNKQEVVEG
jgi:hypothetical protein